MARKVFISIIILFCLFRCGRDEPNNKPLQLLQAFGGTVEIDLSGNTTAGIPTDRSITLMFSAPVNQSTAASSIMLSKGQQPVETDMTFLADGRTVALFPVGPLESNTVYTLVLSAGLLGSRGEAFIPVTLNFKTSLATLTVAAADINGTDYSDLDEIRNAPLNLSLAIAFSAPVNKASLEDAVALTGNNVPGLVFTYSNNDQTVLITGQTPLVHLSRYELTLSVTLKGAQGESFAGRTWMLYTVVDETPKRTVVSDDELLTIVQQQTFSYFWDFAHPASGMARERATSGDVVTSGGSGFGIMSLIVGMERNFISRADGLERIDKILTFLETADRFHGAWPHWMDGNTGDVVPFSVNDNGGDLVETSFLMQGLLTFRQYLDPAMVNESSLIERINALWESVEWDWYTKDEDVLYWHWSPDKEWIMDHPIRGYNEALITYFLAAASPAHAVDPSVYHTGWAGNGAIINNKRFYGITLPLGYDYGGPLFFAHYSFLGLDPRNLQDTYANYWTQNVNHSLINHAHAVANPKAFVGYSDANWGFTASDNHEGYAAHSPTNDLGVITPTAAVSSLPYTPEQSMKALRFFYYTLGDRLWGDYGFYDAFNITEGWTASSHLAIDQGPMIVMIENYRSGLLWDLFMSAPEAQVAIDKLGFTR